MSPVQKEAIDMILHKVGRICSENPNVHDHWDDIAGYAKLASDRIPTVGGPVFTAGSGGGAGAPGKIGQF